MKKKFLITVVVIFGLLAILTFLNVLSFFQLFIIVMVLIPLLAVIFLWQIGKSGINKGLPAVATILKNDVTNFTLSGGERNKSFVLKMEVSVTNEKGETWQTRMIEHIPDFQAAQFQPGFKFKVVYNESDRNKVKAFRSVIDSNTIETVL